MIGRDCRCPGCGTCDAASEVERLRERLAVERTPNGAGKWNAERVLREKAERERDEARHTLGRIAAVLFSSRAPLDDEELVEAVLMVVRERDELQAKLDAELPAMWREDLASLNECLERVSKERDNKNGERIAAEHRAMVAERERDELKARLAHAEADAEQAIHNEAFNERQRIVAWIRAKHLMLSSLAIANCIEQGEHEE